MSSSEILKKLIWAFLSFALISVPARADKWATGTYQTSKPLDQVFDQTVKMIETKRWYITRVRSQIQSINREQRTVHATYVVFGKEWGDIYVSMATQETATSIKAIVRVRSDATLHAANYAHSFGNELKKLFPDLTFEIKRDVVPQDFALGVGQVSMPQVAATAPVVQPVGEQQNRAPTVPETFLPIVAQEPMPMVPFTAPVVQPMQSLAAKQGTVPISPAQINSIDNSLKDIAASLSQQTTSIAADPSLAASQQQIPAPAVPGTFVPVIKEQPSNTPMYQAPSIAPMRDNGAAQRLQQSGAELETSGLQLMRMGAERAAIDAARNKQVEEATTRNAVNQFLSNANQTMSRYLATSGSEAPRQFEITAKAITKARDDAYVTLTNPSQRNMFNRVTNEHVLAFGKQMSDHVRLQASANRGIDEEQQYTENLHRALDSWYANGKDWRKVPPEIWNKLSERDKGRLKDGIDPETINIRTPHSEHSPQR